jgi:hypothetical protein
LGENKQSSSETSSVNNQSGMESDGNSLRDENEEKEEDLIYIPVAMVI